jgi:protein-S-isoprenylcysteine O-methyltransferase Ste14
MKTKNNIITKLAFPPFYFFASISLMTILYFALPEYNITYFPINFIGLLFLVFGSYLTIRYTMIFNNKKTTLQNTEPSFFVKDGFYKYSRNPMYLGGLLFLIGLGILLGNIISFIIIIIFFFVMNFVCIPVEEKIMKNIFKEDYEKYKTNVRRWI